MAVPVEGRVLLDTNVFVDYLRGGLHEEWVAGRVTGTTRFLSAVVLFELRVGASTKRRARAVDRIRRAFPSERILSPTAEVFEHAARVFRAMHGDAGSMADRLGPCNDLLIALTARAIGATVVTNNVREFRRIGAHVSGLRVCAPLARVPNSP